jgi:hypothetical protein
MTTKLKIDLTQGILEVEGSETFVKAIYSDFKLHFIGEDAGVALGSPPESRRRRTSRAKALPAMPASSPPEGQQPADEEAASKAEMPAKSGYKVVQTLQLSGGDGTPSLVEFMDAKFPITNEERNLVFVYYLQHLLKAKGITGDHVFTCYKQAKIRVPANLASSLQTTVTQRRWIKMTKTGRLSVTPGGKLYVEKQLPKKLKG